MSNNFFFNAAAVRADFPIFAQEYKGLPLYYLDSAATSQKPHQVLDALYNFYAYHNASVGRGLYVLAEDATIQYEAARATIARFINAQLPAEVVITHGATDGLHAIAWGFARHQIACGDRIVISALEHHSNMLVWQQLAHECGAELVVIPIAGDGSLDMVQARSLITHRTKIVSLCHVSNVTGTWIDIKTIAVYAHAVGAYIVVDASQSAPHKALDVQALDVDMAVFSGHKMLGPTGVGVLYVNQPLHDRFAPYEVGGGMVYEVGFYKTTWRPIPHMLEAGTPPIAQAIGLAAACTYLASLDTVALQDYEARLCARLLDGLGQVPSVRILGSEPELRMRGHLVSFVMDTIHAHDVAAFLSTKGICVRAGHHCAQPLAQRLGIISSIRASVYCYTLHEEIDALVHALHELQSSTHT